MFLSADLPVLSLHLAYFASQTTEEMGVRHYTFVASTPAQDRNQNTIAPNGWQLGNYSRNPVVLNAHNWFAPPIGASTRVWTEGERLMATIKFADTPTAREIRDLVDQGFLKGMSAGYIPLKVEVRRDPVTGRPVGLHSLSQELVELSVVTIPANPHTLRVAGMESQEADPEEVLSALKEAERHFKEMPWFQL